MTNTRSGLILYATRIFNEFPNYKSHTRWDGVPYTETLMPFEPKVTFSTYKNKNTAKVVVVGASPGGLVSHIPDAYGGSTKDRQLVKCSDPTKKCDIGDSLMADKGINVQDLFASNNITINIPTLPRYANFVTTMTQ